VRCAGARHAIEADIRARGGNRLAELIAADVVPIRALRPRLTPGSLRVIIVMSEAIASAAP